jgi:hypothetical protein
MLLQTNIFTLKHVYTQRLFYTQRLSLTEPFGDNSFSYFAGKFGNHNFTSGFGDRTSFHTKGSRLDKEIVILRQFLAIEPRFVYKGVLDLCDRSFTPVFGI